MAYRAFWSMVALASAYGVGWWIMGDPIAALSPAFLVWLHGYAIYELSQNRESDDHE